MSIFCPEEWVEKHNVLHIKLFSSDVEMLTGCFEKSGLHEYIVEAVYRHTHIMSNFLPVLKLTIHWLFNPIGAQMPSLKKTMHVQ